MGNSFHSFLPLKGAVRSGVRGLALKNPDDRFRPFPGADEAVEPQDGTSKSGAKSDRRAMLVEAVTQVILARRERARHFDEKLFADPAWDILLDLYQAELRQHRATVTSLCEAAAVPATTALRWINNLTEAGLILRHKDPRDARRTFIELSPSASVSMRNFFNGVGRKLAV